MISAVDPEARHARKTPERKQDGFKAHLAVEPDTGLATAAALTKATGPENSDASVGGQLLDADPTIAEANEGGGDGGEAAEGWSGPRCWAIGLRHR